MEVDQSSSLQMETLLVSLATGGLQEQIESGDQSKETADTQQVDSNNDMDEDGQQDDYSSSDSNESLAVDQPSALQVETLGTNLATGGDRVVTSQHILYYCTYYSVSFTCTVHCTYYTYCTLYAQYMFPVSLFPMLRFHCSPHLFTLLYKCSSVALHLTKHRSYSLSLQCLLSSHHLGYPHLSRCSYWQSDLFETMKIISSSVTFNNNLHVNLLNIPKANKLSSSLAILSILICSNFDSW